MIDVLSLAGLVPEAVELTQKVVEAIRAGNTAKAELLAREAAERQALFEEGKRFLDG
jgi:hypothetical protein